MLTSSMLRVKPEDIDDVGKRGKYAISVIGCKRVGLIHAYLFAEAGFSVTCVDVNRAVIGRLMEGQVPLTAYGVETALKRYIKSGRLMAVSDVKTAVERSDVVIMATSAKIDWRGAASYLNVEDICKQAGSGLRRGALVIVVDVVGLGAVEGPILKVLESSSGFKVGVDFGLAYSPIYIQNGQTLGELVSCKRIVAAIDEGSLNAASTILEAVMGGGIIKTKDVRTVEAMMLLKALNHHVNVALANEFALFCEKAKVDYVKVRKLAEEDGYVKLASSTFTCGESSAKLRLLLWDAEESNVKLRTPIAAMEVNEKVLKHAINLIQEALRGCGKSLRRSKISLLGISRTLNAADVPKSLAKELTKMLEAKGAKISLYDPYLPNGGPIGLKRVIKKDLMETLEGSDCVVVLTGHDQFKRLNLKELKAMVKAPAAIVDFDGVMEPDEVKSEGFVYRGFGRGV